MRRVHAGWLRAGTTAMTAVLHGPCWRCWQAKVSCTQMLSDRQRPVERGLGRWGTGHVPQGLLCPACCSCHAPAAACVLTRPPVTLLLASCLAAAAEGVPAAHCRRC